MPSIDDKRLVRVYCLQWLESDFLGYLKEWETSVKGREGFTGAQKATMMLSRETLEGLHITGKNDNDTCYNCTSYAFYSTINSHSVRSLVLSILSSY